MGSIVVHVILSVEYSNWLPAGHVLVGAVMIPPDWVPPNSVQLLSLLTITDGAIVVARSFEQGGGHPMTVGTE